MRHALSVVRYVEGLQHTTRVQLTVGGILLVAAVDYLTGYEAFSSAFYLFPIGFAAWHLGARWGLYCAAGAAFVWLTANLATGLTYSQPWIYGWNTLTRFAVFAVVSSLLSALRASHDHERQLARTDELTGADNKRSFMDLAMRELYRCQRHGRPFSLVLADLDNFKAVNDQRGHATGDALLREVVASAKRELRTLDVVARIGGDEFAILLPETDAVAGPRVAERLRQRLLRAMAEHGWPVTVSMGVVTCVDPAESVEQVLRRADELMYAAKAAGKDGLRQEAFSRTPPDAIPSSSG